MAIDKIWVLFNQEIFLAASGLLLLGFFFGKLSKFISLPRVTGYLVAGIIFGPYFLRIFSENSISQLQFIPQFALGIIALIIGAGLSASLIKRLGMRLIVITLLQALGAFFLVLILLSLLKMPLEAALPLAAIATATAPAATVAVIRECRARGPLTETTLAVVALDDALAIMLFGLILTLDLKHISSFGETALKSLAASSLEIFVALTIGVVLGIICHLLIRTTKEPSDSLIIIIGCVLMGIGFSAVSNVSQLLTNMFLGLTLINISSKNMDVISDFERLTPPIYCILFVLAGAHLNIKVFLSAGALFLAWAGSYILARIIGKVAGAYVGGLISGASEPIRKYLGLTLIPQAGVAIGLSLLITRASTYFPFRSIIFDITLIAVVFNEIFGPALTKYALFKAKEATVEE